MQEWGNLKYCSIGKGTCRQHTHPCVERQESASGFVDPRVGDSELRCHHLSNLVLGAGNPVSSYFLTLSYAGQIYLILLPVPFL